MTATKKGCWTKDLPVPHEALLELGLTEEQIAQARDSQPLVVACQADEQEGAYYDVERASRALKALGLFKHTKGRWAGLPIQLATLGLDPWQVVWILAPIFGWVYYNEEADRVVRVITQAWIEVPRKNGKSTISSGISAVLLLADSEPGAEVYNAAGSEAQAGRVFDESKKMMLSAPSVRKRIVPLKKVVEVPRTGSILRVLSSVGETAHGLNVSGAVIDEVHTLKNKRAVVEAIETGVGARDQPLIIFITTADEDEEGTVYDEKHTYARNIAARVVLDPSFYGVIWAAEKTDDPFSEDTMRKANPGIGKSPTWSYIRKEATKAKGSPTYFPTYCRLSLNLRMRDRSRFINMDDWDKMAQPIVRSQLERRKAWGGLDLAAVSDFAAWSVWVDSPHPDRKFELMTRFWLPELAVETLETQLQVPLTQWIEQGWITVTPGMAIDYDTIQETVIEDSKFFRMQRVSYDRMFAGQLTQNVAKKVRADVVPVPQTYTSISPCMKEMDRMILNKEFSHGGNPVLRWMANMTEAKTDGMDNIVPVKPKDRRKSSARIDGIQAAITGLDGVVRTPEKERHTSGGFHSY